VAGLADVKKRKRKARKAAARAYEAALNTPQRRVPYGANQSQDGAADGALSSVRDWGRYLDENHDLASGVLDELVKNVVGTGIVTIPKPLNADGSIDEVLGVDLMREFERWTRASDVTGELSWSDAQRLICRAWFRDGEEFLQHVGGVNNSYPFRPDDVPYRIELLESEMVPVDLSNDEGWRQGIRQDTWRRPLEYAVARTHPNDTLIGASGLGGVASLDPDNYKRVNSAFMTHIKFVKRWPATRGMSIFSDVISRLYDVKDLEESERIKNRILASWTAAVQRSPDIPGLDDSDTSGQRYLAMAGGTVIDTLAPGETIVGVGPEYPVAGFPEHIADQIRRVASGTGTRYSSISKHYEGSYSALRQEMVESEGAYAIREDAFVGKVVRTVYERWAQAAVLSGAVAVPGYDGTVDATLRLANAEYRGPVTPWIDPLKEVQADALAVEKGFASIDQIRIKRGAPADMIGTPAPVAAAPPPANAPAQLSLIQDDEAAA